MDGVKLKEAISNSGIKLAYMSEQLGLSRSGLYKKINKDTEFTASEIQKVQDILRLSDEDRDDIFFDGKVDTQ